MKMIELGHKPPIYALTSEKNLSKQKLAALMLPKGSILSISQKVVVFKAGKLTELTKITRGLKLVKIFQEYAPPKGFKIEEISPEIYERAPGFEEMKALIVDQLFAGKKEGKITFGLSFYDFDYIQVEFVNHLGQRIVKELKTRGIKTKFIRVLNKPYLSAKKSQKLLKEGLEIVVIKKSSPPLAIYLGKTEKIC